MMDNSAGANTALSETKQSVVGVIEASKLQTAFKAIKPVIDNGAEIISVNLRNGCIVASDSEITIFSETLKLDLPEFFVNGKLLSSVLSGLSGNVKLVLGQDLTVKSGTSKFKLALANKITLPKQEAKDNDYVVVSGDLQSAIAAVLPAAGKDSFAQLSPHSTAATNGQQLMLVKCVGYVPSILLSARASKTVQQLNPVSLQFAGSDNAIHFKASGVTVMIRRPSATFPDYSKIIPGSYDVEYEVKAEEMHEALKQLKPVVGEDGKIVLDFDGAGTVIIRTPDGAGEIYVGANFVEDDPFKEAVGPVTLNHKYLLDYFSIVSKGPVRVGLRNGNQPVVFDSGRIKLIVAQMI